MQQFEDPRHLVGYRHCSEIITTSLKFSDGFRRKVYGILSLAAVLGAFSALSQAAKVLICRCLCAVGRFSVSRHHRCRLVLFGQRLNKGWAESSCWLPAWC